jgi:hypothetical protein
LQSSSPSPGELISPTSAIPLVELSLASPSSSSGRRRTVVSASPWAALCGVPQLLPSCVELRLVTLLLVVLTIFPIHAQTLPERRLAAVWSVADRHGRGSALPVLFFICLVPWLGAQGSGVWFDGVRAVGDLAAGEVALPFRRPWPPSLAWPRVGLGPLLVVVEAWLGPVVGQRMGSGLRS